ncbi:hypothetical protein BV898_18301 [Hypsibius exemplaris]|uniref:Uncharacterized protein n=1 Tax=Hypsibius exemplaris TaxID=2072580 RepID=A0A9X6NH40_HYPEX|nr:hypothetical protein BV898_18301 [Hypsibius exemplaris]
MSNGHGRTDVYVVEQQVKARRILASQSVVAIVLGLIVLAHEIAILVLQIHNLGRPVSAGQIIATLAAFFTVVAGFASYGPSSISASMRSLKSKFIAAAVLGLIATILLAVTQGFFTPRAWDLWRRANSQPGYAPVDYSDPMQTGYASLDASFHVPNSGGAGSGPLGPNPYDVQYNLKVIAILKIVALLGDAILLMATLIITILSVINALRKRAHYEPAPIHDPNHGTRVYYDKNSR